MRTIFVEARSTKKVKISKKILNQLDSYKNIGLVATVQFVGQIDEIKKTLENAGKKVFVGASRQHCVYPGQVLGCDVGSALNVEKEVDCFLYVGTGAFHPLGIAIKSEKPVFSLDPFTSKLSKISNQERALWLKKQAARISKVKDAKVLGILVSVKPGQQMQQNASELRKKLEAQGKKAFIFICDTIVPQELVNFPKIEAWINTSCPRIVEDQELFRKPIVNAEELNL